MQRSHKLSPSLKWVRKSLLDQSVFEGTQTSVWRNGGKHLLEFVGKGKKGKKRKMGRETDCY